METRRKLIESQDRMAHNLETFACRRVAKMIEESKEKCKVAEEFTTLKQIHKKTVDQFK